MKGQLIKLIVLVLVFGGLLYFYFYDKDKAAREETRKTEEKKVFAFESSGVKSATIMRKGEEDIAIRKRDDGTWELKQGRLTADGDETAISTLLSSVVTASKNRTIKDATDMARYGLEEPALVVIVSPTSATGAVTLQIGNAAPEPAFIFARIKDAPEVILINRTVESAANKSLLDLRNKQIVKAAPEEMQKVEIASSTGTVSLEKGSDEFWRVLSPFTGLANKDNVEAVLRKVDSVRAKEFIDDATDLAAYGLLDSATKITVTNKDLAVQTVMVGRKDELLGGYYVKRAASPVVMVVGDDFVTEAIGKEAGDFREQNLFSFKYYNSDIFEVTSAENSYRLENENYTWFVRSPVSATCEYTRTPERLRTVIEAKAVRFVDSVTDAAVFGFDNPSATISARQRDGGVQTILLGNEISGGAEVFAKRLVDDVVMVVSADVLDQAAGPVEDLIQPPATPTPEPASMEVGSATGEADAMDAPPAMPGTDVNLLKSPDEMLNDMTESATGN